MWEFEAKAKTIEKVGKTVFQVTNPVVPPLGAQHPLQPAPLQWPECIGASDLRRQHSPQTSPLTQTICLSRTKLVRIHHHSPTPPTSKREQTCRTCQNIRSKPLCQIATTCGSPIHAITGARNLEPSFSLTPSKTRLCLSQLLNSPGHTLLSPLSPHTTGHLGYPHLSFLYYLTPPLFLLKS